MGRECKFELRKIFGSSVIEALFPLLLAQGPVLLQFLQLWGVLVALSKKTGETTQTWDQAPTGAISQTMVN